MDSIWTTGGFVLDVFIKIIITLGVLRWGVIRRYLNFFFLMFVSCKHAFYYHRGTVWLVFLLVRKVWGIHVSSSGWMPFSLQSFEVSMHGLEVVRSRDSDLVSTARVLTRPMCLNLQRMNRISATFRWRDRTCRFVYSSDLVIRVHHVWRQ